MILLTGRRNGNNPLRIQISLVAVDSPKAESNNIPTYTNQPHYLGRTVLTRTDS